ncbi:uncharacterized protein NPIL_141891 [Nephila pilipes]|uniref:Uncharacterized protein n=1 Tax=Nephila pilipes TaxID=299642 RepID=A0A8X6KDU6_NEPPI|nr:uncharacterized protein NPIL_141891 [Nephila pilipes]
MAIMLALSSSTRAQVIGITCVFGTTVLDNVCNNVKRVLVACNKKEDNYDRMIQVPTTKGRFYSRISNLMVPRSKARGRTFCTDCDLLAVAATLYPESIKSSMDSPLAVECEGTYCRGLTILLKHYRSPDHKRRSVNIVTEFHMDIVNQLRYQMLQDDPITL